jgi:hypothetical protein
LPSQVHVPAWIRVGPKPSAVPHGVKRILEETEPESSLPIRKQLRWFSLPLPHALLTLPCWTSGSSYRDAVATSFYGSLAFPPDLALTFRDSLASRDASLHPPILEFVRVKSPCFRCTLSGPAHQRFHPLISCKWDQPLASAVLMVSHHLDGLSSLKGLGLLRPKTGQDSLNF